MNAVAALRRAGVLGINRRNAAYTMLWNDRRFYPRVDDKLAATGLLLQALAQQPELLGVGLEPPRLAVHAVEEQLPGGAGRAGVRPLRHAALPSYRQEGLPPLLLLL